MKRRVSPPTGGSPAPHRYEVWANTGDGGELRMGWTDHADGGGFLRIIEAHPIWTLSRIVDTQARSEAG